MSIFKLLEAWDLIEENSNLSFYSNSKIRQFCLDLEKLYNEKLLERTSNTLHLGINEAIEAMENPGGLRSIANGLILSRKLILPDPLYSFLSPRASKIWGKLPWSGSNQLIDPGPYTQWKNYWSPPINERQVRLHHNFPALRNNLLLLRPLAESGAISFYPWEIEPAPV